MLQINLGRSTETIRSKNITPNLKYALKFHSLLIRNFCPVVSGKKNKGAFQVKGIRNTGNLSDQSPCETLSTFVFELDYPSELRLEFNPQSQLKNQPVSFNIFCPFVRRQAKYLVQDRETEDLDRKQTQISRLEKLDRDLSRV